MIKPYLLLSLSFFAGSCAYADASKPAARKQPSEPMAFFSQTTEYSFLQTLGVQGDRKLTCQIACANTFIITNAQAYGICYDTQTACLRWGLLRNVPEGPTRQFSYAETTAYLQACAMAIESTASGGSLADNLGFYGQTSGAQDQALITSDPARAQAAGASSQSHEAQHGVESGGPDLAESALKPLPS